MIDDLENSLRRELGAAYVPFDAARAGEMIHTAIEADPVGGRRRWAAPLAAAAAVVVVGGGAAIVAGSGTGSSGAQPGGGASSATPAPARACFVLAGNPAKSTPRCVTPRCPAGPIDRQHALKEAATLVLSEPARPGLPGLKVIVSTCVTGGRAPAIVVNCGTRSKTSRCPNGHPCTVHFPVPDASAGASVGEVGTRLKLLPSGSSRSVVYAVSCGGVDNHVGGPSAPATHPESGAAQSTPH